MTVWIVVKVPMFTYIHGEAVDETQEALDEKGDDILKVLADNGFPDAVIEDFL